MKKLFALTFALILALSLAACSNARKPQEEARLQDESTTDPTSETSSPAPQVETCAISELRPFSEGLAWVKYTQADVTVKTGAINTKGELVFALDNNPTYCSPFTDGVAFCIENKSFAIYDNTGAKLYSGSGGENAYIMLGYGNGHFLVAKHVQNMDTNEWRLGTIDKNGKVLNEAEAYSGTEYDKRLIEYIVNGVPLGGRGSYSTSEGFRPTEYLGEDIMSAGRGGYIYSIKDNSINYHSGVITGKFVDNKLILGDMYSMRAMYILPSPYTGKDSEVMASFDAIRGDGLSKWKLEQGPSAVNNLYNEGLVWGSTRETEYKYVYFDISGNIVLSFPDLAGKSFEGSPFVGGYAILKITGADKKTYITAIDKTGTQQYTPLAVESVNIFESSNGYVWAKINGKEVIVDPQGKAKTAGVDDLSGIGDAKFRDIAEGFIIFSDKYVSLDGKTVIDSVQVAKQTAE